MKRKIASNTPHTRLGKVTPFKYQLMLAIFTLVAALWLLLPIPASAQLEVEVKIRQRKLAGSDRYTYTFNVNNRSKEGIRVFVVEYDGGKPLAHIEPSGMSYQEEESMDDSGNVLLRKIKWRAAFTSGYISLSETGGFQLTFSEPIPGVSWVAQNVTGNLASDSVAFGDPEEPKPDSVASITLTPGINMISLPLNPKQPFTASSLANTLAATIVIRAESGSFEVYMRQGGVGTDFPIEMGKGYIVNLTAPKTFEVIGQSWGVPVAPHGQTAVSAPTEPWAFVVTGHITNSLPVSATVRITNPRTSQRLSVPIESDGAFVGVFVDMINQRAVVAPGDRLRLELIDAHGQPLSEPEYPQIVSTNIARAYMRTTLTASPQKSRLLQNFPNPFNPETWIPYQLNQEVAVTIQMYDAAGRLIRQLELGYQSAGFYTSREKAAYWNGKNQYGEAVASGNYYVHLRAGSFHAVRRMVVLK